MLLLTYRSVASVTLSAFHLYGKPGNSGENSNGVVHPGGHFSGKGNIFRDVTFFPALLKEMTEIFCTIFVDYQCQASFRVRGFTGIL